MFSIVIPIYNEADNIKLLLNEIIKELHKYKTYEIVIVNDASTDNSSNIIKNFKFNNLKVFKNQINKGQSFSICRGIQESSNNIIVTIDGDGQNDPRDIPKLVDYFISDIKINLVAGIRNKRQDNIIKVISSKLANYIRSKILNDNCKDTGCSLKVFNRNIFLSFPYFDGIHRFIPALFKGYGYDIVFINVNHRKRKFGYSKYGTMNRLFKGIRDIVKVKKIIKNNK